MKFTKCAMVALLFFGVVFCKKNSPNFKPGLKLQTPFGDTIQLVTQQKTKWEYDILKNGEPIFRGSAEEKLFVNATQIK